VVNRYIDLVYSTALRLVNGDVHSAEDITQRAFADLAKMAGRLSKEVLIGGWLHRHTCFLAQKLIRAETRRKERERTAMEMKENQEEDENLRALTPVVDDAIDHLKAEDRDAILLRFFEQRDFHSLGQALGTSEEAARKRVNRALEKLRLLLARRGVALSTAALGTLLATKTIQAAPVGLAVAVGSAAITTAAAGGGTASIALHFMTMTKTQAGIIAAITLAAGIPLAMQHQQKTQLRNENVRLRQQVEQFAGLQQENERLSNLLAKVNRPSGESQTDQHKRELMKLRGEVGTLRRTVDEAAAAPNQRRRVPSVE
jgi:RNA polymerase sigma factor (sigma-70 family)